MTYNILEKNISLSSFTKERIQQKINRIERLFPEDTSMSVKVSSEKVGYKIELTFPLSKRLVRAEVVHEDFMAALDKSIDIIEQQLVKHKGRMRSKVRKNIAFKNEYESIPVKEEQLLGEELDILIEKDKKFELMPMDVEEAVMQMELLGHTFFVFLNADHNEVNVVYKRKNGNYGLISPEV